jgi:hypothetical protein
VSLKVAREKHSEARKLLASGVDPGENKKATKATQGGQVANSFEIIAREWFISHSPNLKENHSSKIIARLENDIFPWVEIRSISEITDVTHPIRRLRRFAQIKNKTCVSVVISATTPVAAR